MNQAQRLLNLFVSLTGRGADQPMTQVWSAVFELNPQSQSIEDDVMVCLLALRSEIDSVSNKLISHDVNTELMEPGFSRFKATASPQYINQNWDGLRGNIQAPECRLSFLWAAWALREEDDDDIQAQDKAAIEDALIVLEKALAESNISPYLKSFVQRQVTAIRNALRIAKVQGAEPLREAMRKFAGDLKVEDTKFKAAISESPEEAKITLKAMAEVIEKAAKICDGANKVWSFTQSIGGLVSDLMLPYVK
ncbi:hypothetical protein os1_01010 [Comamonadaceae bacterium OS-1]|nr:hypothetical protein os1_01010 [Comamonadaceae bacterium OS-1]